jgi:hypothetical protein
VTPDILTTCALCGDVVRSVVGSNWNPSTQVRRAQEDMEAHLMTHSFAELLRFEIRQDLEQVPEEQRPTIVRDVYRGLLGDLRNGEYRLNACDGLGVYSIDEVLGDLDVYRLWVNANACGRRGCRHA